MGKNLRTEVIAEIANTHQGDPDYAYKLAKICQQKGADAIKFQIYFAEELLSKKHPRFQHFKNQSFAKSIWKDLIKSLKNSGTHIYADIFGLEAFNLAKNCDLDGIKIHSSDLNNYEIFDNINNNKKKYFLSAGGSTIREIHSSIKILNKKNIKPILMHGFQAYPTSLQDNNLNRILFFKDIFTNRCQFGFQDHTYGGSKMAFLVPHLAKSLGVQYIEKHVILERTKNRVDYYSSLQPNEFGKFVELIKSKKKPIVNKRLKAKILGENDFDFSKAEKNYRNKFKKIWFSKNFIPKNSIIKKSDLTMKRSQNTFINSVDPKDFLNKITLKNIKSNTAINKSFVKNNVIALIVARSASKRLKDKAFKKICGLMTIEHLILRVKRAKKINKIILCTTKNKEDKVFKNIAKKHKIDIFFGDNLDVLKRMNGALKKVKCDLALRITGDDILIDPTLLDKNIQFHLENNLEYSNNKKLPSGMEVEIFNKDLLFNIEKISVDTKNTEYLTFYVEDNIQQIQHATLDTGKDYRNIRMTLDNENDFQIIKIFLQLMKKKKKLFSYGLNEVVKFYKQNVFLFKKNTLNKVKGVNVNTSFNWKKL